MEQKVQLDKFDPKIGLDRGAPKIKELIWYVVKIFFFLSAIPWPKQYKVSLLKLFGAKIGHNVYIKPRVNIHFPWKLVIGDNCWIGEEVFILNFESCRIGNNVCISQRAFLCGGNHDYKDSSFKYRNGPITVEEEAWVGANVFVAPNVTIKKGAVITAGSVVYQSQPENMVCSGNPCVSLKSRY